MGFARMTQLLMPFFTGAIVMGFLVSGLFFLKFWHKTYDRLFLAFSISFWLLGLNQLLLLLSNVSEEDRSWFYMLRLLAFLIILIAIWRKNASVKI
jgi:hypothetical protein